MYKRPSFNYDLSIKKKHQNQFIIGGNIPVRRRTLTFVTLRTLFPSLTLLYNHVHVLTRYRVGPSQDLPVADMPSPAHSQLKGKHNAKMYAKITAANSNNLNTEFISEMLSQFVTQLNSLITPLISLVSTLLQTFISKATLSP